MFGGKKEKKFCPFIPGIPPCHKEKCMLWNEEEQDCNINVLVKELKKLK